MTKVILASPGLPAIRKIHIIQKQRAYGRAVLLIGGRVRVMKSPSKFNLLKWLHVFVWVYFTLVFAWAVAHFLLGDHPWWMFAANALAFYLFWPLLLVVPSTMRMRRWQLWLGTLAVFLLAVVLYGKLFLPWKTAFVPAGPSLTVMTYNVLGYNTHPDAVVDSILAVGPDVVSLQELNLRVAHAIRQKLLSAYPYQQLDARDDVFGMGVISRYPLHLSDETLPGGWVGTPQILTLTVGGQSITILNVHALATSAGVLATLDQSISERERQARTIRDFAQTHPGPLIVTTDFNSTDMNASYQIVTSALSDAWMEAGWGPGNTFPALVDSHVPIWAIRIDYIFYSNQFRTTAAEIRDWDGSSDHRPMLARLVLTDY